MSPRDAFEPGEDGTFSAWPRDEDGAPIFSGTRGPMPNGTMPHRSRSTGKRVVIDVTPRHPDGTPIVPPTTPPEEAP